jgi:hypothetical protein
MYTNEAMKHLLGKTMALRKQIEKFDSIPHLNCRLIN